MTRGKRLKEAVNDMRTLYLFQTHVKPIVRTIIVPYPVSANMAFLIKGLFIFQAAKCDRISVLWWQMVAIIWSTSSKKRLLVAIKSQYRIWNTLKAFCGWPKSIWTLLEHFIFSYFTKTQFPSRSDRCSGKITTGKGHYINKQLTIYIEKCVCEMFL